jgi:hypothetical protein
MTNILAISPRLYSVSVTKYQIAWNKPLVSSAYASVPSQVKDRSFGLHSTSVKAKRNISAYVALSSNLTNEFL